MSAFASFRAARWVRTTNIVLQAILFLGLFLEINFLAGTHRWREDPWRYDLTRYRRFSLAPETRAYLKELSSPVQIYVTAGEDAVDREFPDLKGLLREYAYATEGSSDGKITVEYLDIDLRPPEARQLKIDQTNEIVLICNGKRHVLQIADLYRSEARDRIFQGEGAITAAILDVASSDRKKIYFLVAHEELRLEDPDPVRGLSVVRDWLSERNFVVESLDLSTASRVPADAALVVGVQPRSPFEPREQEMLQRYLGANSGRLILFLAPESRHGLERLLQDWGIAADDDLLHDSGPDNLTEDGDFIITWFSPSHPVTQSLRQVFKPRLRVGLARSVRPVAGSAAANGLDVTILAATSSTAWGEVNYGRGGRLVFHPGVDVRPLPNLVPPNRLGIAVASERVAARNNLPFSVPTGRLLVFGTGDLIDNARIANDGVLSILSGAVNWMVDRDTQLKIHPRPIERFQLSLSAREHDDLRYCLMFFLPGAAALLGLIVYWTRRN